MGGVNLAKSSESNYVGSKSATLFNASSTMTSGNSYWIQCPAPGTMTGQT